MRSLFTTTISAVGLIATLIAAVPSGLTADERAANGVHNYEGPLPVVRIKPDGSKWCDVSRMGDVRIEWVLREDGTGTADIWLADQPDTRPDWMLYNLKRVSPNVWEGIVPDDGDSAAPDMGNPIAQESYFRFGQQLGRRGFHQDLTVLFVDGTRHTCSFDRLNAVGNLGLWKTTD